MSIIYKTYEDVEYVIWSSIELNDGIKKLKLIISNGTKVWGNCQSSVSGDDSKQYKVDDWLIGHAAKPSGKDSSKWEDYIREVGNALQYINNDKYELMVTKTDGDDSIGVTINKRHHTSTGKVITVELLPKYRLMPSSLPSNKSLMYMFSLIATSMHSMAADIVKLKDSYDRLNKENGKLLEEYEEKTDLKDSLQMEWVYNIVPVINSKKQRIADLLSTSNRSSAHTNDNNGNGIAISISSNGDNGGQISGRISVDDIPVLKKIRKDKGVSSHAIVDECNLYSFLQSQSSTTNTGTMSAINVADDEDLKQFADDSHTNVDSGGNCGDSNSNNSSQANHAAAFPVVGSSSSTSSGINSIKQVKTASLLDYMD